MFRFESVCSRLSRQAADRSLGVGVLHAAGRSLADDRNGTGAEMQLRKTIAYDCFHSGNSQIAVGV